MRPAARTRVWRKARRAALKGADRGRRARRVLIEAPRRSSTWLRRHPGQIEYWLTHAGTDRLIADLQKMPPPAGEAAEGDRTAEPTTGRTRP
jgi:hypothetical protein